METLAGYADCIVKAFDNVIKHGFTPNVEDVYCVPDYKAFLKEFIDKDFSNIHRFSSPLSLFEC